jgi:hypothetical protein
MPFLTTFSSDIAWDVVYISTWILPQCFVPKSGAVPGSGTVLRLHNGVQVGLSFFLLTNTLLYLTSGPCSASVYVTAVQLLKENQVVVPRYAYQLSKFYGYLNILFFVANGGSVDLHIGFHHLMTPYSTWFRVSHGYDGSGVFAALNPCHHVLRYVFAGVTATHAFLPYTRYV